MSDLREKLIHDLRAKKEANRKALDAALKPKEFKLPQTIEELRSLDATSIRELLMGPHKQVVDQLLSKENGRLERAARKKQREEDDRQEEIERQMAQRISGDYRG